MGSRLRGNNQEARECWRGWIPASAGTKRGRGNAGREGFPPPSSRGQALRGKNEGSAGITMFAGVGGLDAKNAVGLQD